MATSITTIQSTDLITNSRADINNNFDSLLVNKIETDVITTDSTFAAASDSKLPSQLAVKQYVDAGGNVNASTTAKGIVEEATQEEVAAGTQVGATGARLFVNPGSIPRATTVIPLPHGDIDASYVAGPGGSPITDPTIGYIGQIVVPFTIEVSSVSIRTTNVTTPGPLDITLYTEDGQTQIFSVTSSNLVANSINTVAVSAAIVPAGVYYIMVNANGSFSAQIYMYRQGSTPFALAAGLLGDVSGQPVLRGTISITSGTPPATISPTAITDALDGVVVCRFDN